MTRAWFDAQMARLMGLRFPPADTETHWEALYTVPDAVLEAAVARAGKTRDEFPTPNELAQDCDAVAHLVCPSIADEDRGVELEPPQVIYVPQVGRDLPVTRLWRFYHEDCGDSGTESLWCGEAGPSAKPWQVVQRCERTRIHEPHEWIRRCTCYESNPALVQKRERERQYAERKGSKKVA